MNTVLAYLTMTIQTIETNWAPLSKRGGRIKKNNQNSSEISKSISNSKGNNNESKTRDADDLDKDNDGNLIAKRRKVAKFDSIMENITKRAEIGRRENTLDGNDGVGSEFYEC